MIVNATHDGWEIIFQRNHALVAGMLALEIRHEYRPPRWTETLSAIIEHDDGQADWFEENQLSEEGEPLDFTQYEFDLIQAKRAVEDAKYKSQWMALLVSLHTQSLYGNLQNKPASLVKFLEEQNELQKELKNAFLLNTHQLENYYKFFRWCDECSLILCQNRLTTDPIEIGSFRKGKPHYIRRSEGNSVTVEPWCFGPSNFSVAAEVYHVKQKKFNSTQALKESIEASKPFRKVWEFTKN